MFKFAWGAYNWYSKILLFKALFLLWGGLVFFAFVFVLQLDSLRELTSDLFIFSFAAVFAAICGFFTLKVFLKLWRKCFSKKYTIHPKDRLEKCPRKAKRQD